MAEGWDLNCDWPETKLFIRGTYEKLWKMILSKSSEKGLFEKHSFLILGNPGIGKTCFLLYVMSSLVKDVVDVKFVYSNTAETPHYYMDSTTGLKIKYGDQSQLVEAILSQPRGVVHCTAFMIVQ